VRPYTRRVCRPRAAKFLVVLLSMAAFAQLAPAATIFSFTGTLPDPQDYVVFTLTTHTSGAFKIQTYGFGGGTNLNSQVIPPGGFDPFVGVFYDSGLYDDGSSDILNTYYPNGEPDACGSANEVFIDASTGDQCGDVALLFQNGSPYDISLAAGTYTIILSDALFYPAAASEPPGGNLADGFDDFTAGSPTFSTCYDTCITDNGNWAIDFETTAEGGATITETQTPEPASLLLTGAGLLVVGAIWRRRLNTPRSK
jgi:hypothetical protein